MKFRAPGAAFWMVLTAVLLSGCGGGTQRRGETVALRSTAASEGVFVDLRPSTWSEDERRRFTALNNTFGVDRPLIEGRRFMLAGIQSSYGLGAGQAALHHGGSAMDAAIASALAQVVVQGGYGVSLAGFMNAIYFDAKTGRVHTLNASYNTVQGETDPLTIPTLPNSDARSTLVPGFMAGIEAAHRKFGRLPFRSLVEPAIEIAETGFAVPARLASVIQWKRDLLLANPEARSIFTRPDGSLLQKGDWFRQPQLAHTLRRVADEGASYMYDGIWARRFIDALRVRGGRMTLKDLQDYRVVWADPIETTYRGKRVVTLPPPNHGGYQELEMLNLMEQADLVSQGHYATSSNALFTMMQLSLVGGYLQPDHTYNFGAGNGLVPSFFPAWKTDPVGRLDKAQARSIVRAIGTPKWQEFQSAVLERMRPQIEEERRVLAELEKPQRTDCVVAVDADGNIAVLIHTFNGLAWGYGLFVDGVSVPDSGALQQQAIRDAGPGKRLPDPTQPLLVLEGDRPVLASCNCGSWLHPGLSQYLTSVLDFDLDPADALRLPQFWAVETEPVDGREETVFGVPPGAFSEAIIEEVRSKGQRVKVMQPGQHYGRSTYWVGVTIDPKTGRLRGGVTPVFNGAVIAE